MEYSYTWRGKLFLLPLFGCTNRGSAVYYSNVNYSQVQTAIKINTLIITSTDESVTCNNYIGIFSDDVIKNPSKIDNVLTFQPNIAKSG